MDTRRSRRLVRIAAALVLVLAVLPSALEALPRFLPSLAFPPDKPPRRTYVPNAA